jgi:hypothetical protein
MKTQKIPGSFPSPDKPLKKSSSFQCVLIVFSFIKKRSGKSNISNAVAVALKLQQISGKLFPFVYFYRRKKISESAEEENEIQAKPENYSELIFREPIRQKVQISRQKLLVKTKYKLVKANQSL